MKDKHGTYVCFSVTRDGETIDLVVYGSDYRPGSPVKMSGHPDTWSPADPDEAEIGRIEVDDGKGGTVWTGELTSAEEREALGELIVEMREDHADRWESEMERRAEARAEAMAEREW